jgi:hypothetical protein
MLPIGEEILEEREKKEAEEELFHGCADQDQKDILREKTSFRRRGDPHALKPDPEEIGAAGDEEKKKVKERRMIPVTLVFH